MLPLNNIWLHVEEHINQTCEDYRFRALCSSYCYNQAINSKINNQEKYRH